MSTRIYYRGPIVWNLILFVIFSFAFVYLQEIFKSYGSVLDKGQFESFIKGHFTFIILLFLCLATFFFQKLKLGKIMFFIISSLSIILTVINLNLMFSKFILILLFFYVLISFYFYQFYGVELSESCYNSKIDADLLYAPMLHRICLSGSSKKGQAFSGYLTNWSEEGCYICLDNPMAIRGQVEFNIKFQNHEFLAKGFVVASEKNNTGFGLKLIPIANEERLNRLGWAEFYEIIEEMGFKSELLL